MKKILAASVAALALSFTASAAVADEPDAGCGFDSVQNDTGTGQNYEGVVYGYAVHADGGEVALTCYIQVNNVPAPGATVSNSGTGATFVAGPISFEATVNDDVELCTSVTAHGSTTTTCGDSDSFQIPPQELLDAIDSIFDLIAEATAPLDPIICDALRPIIPVLNTLYPATGLYFDPDDCDIWLVGVLPVAGCPVPFVPPIRLIDFIAPYGDPYTGPTCP